MRSVPAPCDLRAHRRQARGEIDDFRLARGVFERRDAVGQRRRHHQVFRSGYRDDVERESRALEPGRAGVDVAVRQIDLRAHRLQALDVLVDRPQADRAAAGQRHARLAGARDQRSEREDRRAHRLHELVRRERPVDRRRVERHGAGLAGLHVDAHLREQRLHRLHVVQPRHVGERQRLGREQRRAQDRQARRSSRPRRALRRGARHRLRSAACPWSFDAQPGQHRRLRLQRMHCVDESVPAGVPAIRSNKQCYPIVAKTSRTCACRKPDVPVTGSRCERGRLCDHLERGRLYDHLSWAVQAGRREGWHLDTDDAWQGLVPALAPLQPPRIVLCKNMATQRDRTGQVKQTGSVEKQRGPLRPGMFAVWA